VTYKGTIDGQPIAEMVPANKKIWGTQENTWEEAGVTGSDVLGVPAVVEGVVGMKAGESKTVEQAFGDDHVVEALRGKTGSYSIDVHEVRERIMPELNEEFAKELKLESLEDLRSRIREELQRQKEGQRRVQQRNQVANHLLGAVSFPVPESAIEAETQALMERTMRENMMRGVPEEAFNKHKEEFYGQSREISNRQVRRDFMLMAIARKEKITIDNSDMSRAVYAQAQRYRVKPDDIVKELKDNQDTLRSFQRSVLIDKVLEWLVDRRTSSRKPLPPPRKSRPPRRVPPRLEWIRRDDSPSTPRPKRRNKGKCPCAPRHDGGTLARQNHPKDFHELLSPSSRRGE
jgi:trigger factor